MKAHSVSIGLVNPKSPTNVGAVMRAAGCFGVDEVYYTGARYDRAKRFQTDTKDNTLHIPLRGVDDLLAHVSPNTKVVCVELVLGATPLPEFSHPENAFYIFGPEDGSVNQTIIDKADSVVYIPTKGCLNLAATVNVLLYDRISKLQKYERGDALIEASRDTNNRTSIAK